MIVKKHFRPKFPNRLDDIVLFHPLSQYEVKNIVQMQLEKVRARFLEQRKIKVDFTPSAVEYIGKVSYDRAFGAR